MFSVRRSDEFLKIFILDLCSFSALAVRPNRLTYARHSKSCGSYTSGSRRRKRPKPETFVLLLCKRVYVQKVFEQYSEPFDIYVNKSLQAFPEFSSGELSEVLELAHTSDYASILQKQRQYVSDIVIIVRSRAHGRCKRESFCLKSTETRLFIRDGWWREGWEREREGSIAGANPEDQDAADRRQNNKTLRQWPFRHCTATSVLRSCCFNYCTEQSHEDNVRSAAFEKQLKPKKSSSQAQLHLPAHDLFWANLRVQLHLPALDLFCANLWVQHHLLPLALAWTHKSV